MSKIQISIKVDENDTISSKEVLEETLAEIFRQTYTGWSDDELRRMCDRMIRKTSMNGDVRNNWDKEPTLGDGIRTVLQHFDKDKVDEIVERAARSLL